MIRRREPGTIGSWPDGTPALLQRLHAARGAPSLETAQPGLRHLLPPDTLSGLDDATALLAAAMPAWQAMPWSTVTRRSGCRAARSSTSPGERP
jgi:hypothetical protein